LQRASRYLTHVLVLMSVVSLPALTLGSIKAGHGAPVVTAYGAGTTVSLDRAFELKPPALKAAPLNRAVQTYVVQQGDTLSGIGDAFGLTIDSLRWANNLSDVDSLSLGEKLLIPPVDGVLVTVKAGDTAASLAAKYSVSADTIIAFNLLRDPTHLAVGSYVMVPSGTGDPLQSGPNSRAASGSPVRTSSSSLGPVFHATGPNHFPWGWCTWYVASRRYVPWNGDAHTWYANAQAYGYAVGRLPRVGAIMVTWESWWGHVAYVEAVNGSCWTVSEMNYRGFGMVDYRHICPGQVPLIGFVY